MNDSVRLMHYDPRWRQEFEQTRSSLLSCCAGWVTEVEHVGSTAISGLIARPTIDMIAAAEDEAAIKAAIPLIEGLNFRVTGSLAWSEQTTQLWKPRHTQSSGWPTHRVILVARPSLAWLRILRVRDHLRANPELAIELEEVKVASWRQGEGDAERYRRSKSRFFASLEEGFRAS